MKKYYMKGTEDELAFGDVIEVTLVDEKEDGSKTHRRVECKFIDDEKCINMLLDMDIIEVEETDDELIDFDEEDAWLEEYLDELSDVQEELEQRVDTLEEHVKELMETNMKYLKEILKEVKNVNKSNGKKNDTK